MIQRFLTLLAVFGMATTLHAAEPESSPKVDPKEGECWSYATRPGEEESFVVVRKIETLPKLGEVVHVSIFGLKVKNPAAKEGFTAEIGHLPIAAENLRASLQKKIEKKIPDFNWEDGYRQWKEGQGGILAKPISECVSIIETVVQKTRQPKEAPKEEAKEAK